MLNILNEPVIRADASDGSRVEASLPEVYAMLMADKIDAFPALRPHQRHAWHAFLVQLGAMAMHRDGRADPPKDAAEWLRIIRALTLDDYPDAEPWQMVVTDLTKPAFMQPPASSKEREKDYKSTVATPDELDMLVTSKNHDLKAAVATQADPDEWLFALVTLQTMEGYAGRFNYGISRMPSGYGNRSAFSITPSIRPGIHARRDMEGLLEHRKEILDEYPMAEGGIGLMWTLAWDGTKAEALLISQMGPFYIEVCRRIRLREKKGELKATRANSDSRRIVDIKGLTGDPWSPVGKSANRRGTPPAFLGPRKFSYERVVDGLFSPDWARPYLLRPTQYDRNFDKTTQLVARGMVRGEGGTEGYHERIIPLRHKAMQVFGRVGAPQRLEDIARERIKQAGIVQSILRHAIATFAAHGNSDGRTHGKGKPSPNDLARPWANRLDEIVDARFFDDLQTEFESDDPSEGELIRNKWLLNVVIANAQAILSTAQDSLPCPTIQRYRARASAQNLFDGQKYQRLRFLFE